MAHRGRAFHFNREHLSPAPNDIIRVFALCIGDGALGAASRASAGAAWCAFTS